MSRILRFCTSPFALSAAFGVVFTLGVRLLAMDRGDGLGSSHDCGFASGAILATLLFFLLRAGRTPAPAPDGAGAGETTEDAGPDPEVQVGLLLLRFLLVAVLADACRVFATGMILLGGLGYFFSSEMIEHPVFCLAVLFAPARQVVEWGATRGGAPVALLFPVVAALQVLLAWGVAVALVRSVRRTAGKGPAAAAPRIAVRLARVRVALFDPRRIAALPSCVVISAALGVGPAYLVTHTSLSFDPPALMLLALAGAGLALSVAGLVGELRQTWACMMGRTPVLPTRAVGCRRLAALVAVTGLATLAGPLIGIEVKTARCRGICERLNPLIAAVELYRSAHGEYPPSVQSLPSYPRLTEGAGVSVRAGEFEGAHGISMSGVNEADATLYLGSQGYQCNVLIRAESRALSSSYDVFLRAPGQESWMRHTIWASLRLGDR